MSVTFTVYGIPQTKGSARAYLPKGRRFPVITNDNPKNKPWAQLVSVIAQQYAPAEGPWLGPIRLKVVFRLPIPKSLPKRRPSWMTKKPDLSKMLRSLEDALTGVIYRDDAQVVGADVSKVYHPQPGVVVTVEQIDQNYEGPVVYAYRPYESIAG